MGQCIVTVHVTGFHHNGRADDIDQMAADFVEKLQAAGHTVTAAYAASGGEQDLLDKSSRFPVKD